MRLEHVKSTVVIFLRESAMCYGDAYNISRVHTHVIENVWRRAAMVVRKPLATFSSEVSASPTLSALPSPEKERLLRTQGTEKEATKGLSLNF